MKCRGIRIKNFRLLRDLELNFSTSSEKPLTVIRAENETGKTTILAALQWALFGEDGLPAKGRYFRIHPIDWEKDNSNKVEIEIELEFEHTWEKQNESGIWIKNDEIYIALRRVEETLYENDKWRRGDSSFELLNRTESGFKPIKGSSEYLKSILGSNLKDLFFTDGDRALGFITSEITVGEKRKMVQKAIRDMLSFEILESTVSHVQKSGSHFRSQVKEFKGANELQEVNEKINDLEKSKEETEKRLKDIDEQLSEVQTNIRIVEQKIEKALEKGDKDKLIQELNDKRNLLNNSRKELKKFTEIHGTFLHSEETFKNLLKNHLNNSCKLLNELKEKGRIPRTSIPVLKERLEMGKCICGEDLLPGENHYQNIVQLIEDQEVESDIDDRLTSLRIISNQKLEYVLQKNDWQSRLQYIIQKRNELEEKITDFETDIKEIDRQIETLPETEIQFLKEQRNNFRSTSNNLIKEQGIKESNLNRYKLQIRESKERYNKLLKSQDQAIKIESRLIATNDIFNVIKSSYNEIEQSEIPEVSKMMNELFLRMIRSDPQQNSLICETEVSPEYDIVVYGPNRKNLDPDRDLNGASRRALTLAFILALTGVSGVKAPNVIDTPLGMMDPLVKQSVLKTLVKNSEQLILFLTRSEIKDCEKIIDQYAGVILTLSNTAHYPTMLENDPKSKIRKIISCGCNHKQYCDLCERIADTEDPNLEYRNT